MNAVIDAHHHIWRRADLPWLEGPMQPRIFGPYEPIRRDYPISEYLADIAGCDIVRSVYVQANWAKEAFADEVAYVQRAADETGYPQAIVGYADFLAADVRPQLDRLSKYPGLRGLRMQLHWHENPQYCFAAKPDLARDPTLQKNVAQLARLRLELRPPGLRRPDGRCQRTRRRLPQSDFRAAACRHAGGSFPRGVDTVARRHARACRATKRCLQAVGAGHLHPSQRPRPHRGDGEGDRRHVRHRRAACSVRTFRSKNCGPGIPISFAAYRRALEPFGEAAARAALHDTAARVYRLN